jgi:hypothetical protein
MPLCNAGQCIAVATHGSVCVVHAKHPVTTQSRRDTAEFLKIGIDYDFTPATYIRADADVDEDWITIATIGLHNALSDTITIEAQERFESIELRITDDAEGEYRWKSSDTKRPLSLRELIALIDSTKGPCGRGLVFAVLNYNLREGGVDPTDLERFVEVASEFYPDLARHYEAELLLWVDERNRT